MALNLCGHGAATTQYIAYLSASFDRPLPMSKPTAFLSHSSRDDAFVKALRQALEFSGASAWADSRQLLPGDALQPSIEQAIRDHEVFFLVFSQHTLQSRWVKKELDYAKSLQKRIVTLLLDEQTVGTLAWLFDDEPVAIPVSTRPGGLQSVLPHILTALGLSLPDDIAPAVETPEPPVNELCLVLDAPELYTEGGVRRGRARAHFALEPADGGETIETDDFDFICPLGPIEAGRMRDYIEDYPQRPFLEKMLSRIAEIEREIPGWGQKLFEALTATPDTLTRFLEWKGDQVHERRFSVKFNFLSQSARSAEQQEAANILMATPWEILHDGQGFLFQGKKPVRVRRRVPNRGKKDNLPLRDRLRVLLLSPRPVDERAGYIDHRVAPAALLAALEPLGDRAELVLLREPTFAAMCAAIRDAETQGNPFSVVHFDGHGVFDPYRGLGALCFESNEAGEQQKLEGRKTHLVYADELLAELRGYRIPFFFLDACQSAVAEKDPSASVAATLLQTGAASVAAMSYSVLVSTAEAFAKAFYAALAQGKRIGSAMLEGQRALHADPVRAQLPKGEKLTLQDWFVPVLFQEQKDPQLVRFLPGEQAQRISAEARAARAGDTPAKPHGGHNFVGRKLELLTLERLLLLRPWAALVGAGGAGKTTLAAELARWMLRTGRFDRLAFVSFEGLRDVRTIILLLGNQLIGSGFADRVAENEEQAMLEIERRLAEFPTLIVLDNLESIQPLPGAEPLAGVAPLDEFLQFFSRLLKTSPRTRLLFTSRETLPAPFDTGFQTRRLGALAPADALHLVAEVMQNAGIEVPSLNVEDLDEQFGALARSANYHARALTLLTQSLAVLGDTTRDILLGFNADYAHLMAELERKHPGERENSLFASLELSLRRLPPDVRTVVDALAVYHGGADVATWAMVAECEQDAAAQAGMALVQVGLAEVSLDEFPYFFKIDPALPAWLTAYTPPDLLAARQQRWVEATMALSGFLYEQKFQNSHLAHDLARLTEANLVAMLGTLEKMAESGQLVQEAGKVEALFSTLSRPQVLQFAQGIRERAAARLAEGGGWSHAQFLSRDAAVDRLLEQGNLPAAYQMAQETLAQCERAGANAYPEAAYDGAMAHAHLGRVLSMAGQSEQALPYFQTARQRLLALAGAGGAGAERMASVCLTEMGDCFLFLGRYEAAAGHYQQAIELDEKRGDFRDVAVGRTQLATTRMLQKNYPEALRLHEEAKAFFERNGEAAMMATAWHQIGMVHQEAQNYPAAEKAYQQSLEIKIREKNKAGEASSVDQLGILYSLMGKLEDSVTMHEKAANIRAELKDLLKEGRSRNNLAIRLLQLHRPAEARTQLLRAIECLSQFGHAAEPWKTWDTLCNLETAEGNPAAATEARAKAMQAYAAYRKDGGESQSNHFQLIAATAQAMQAGQEGELIPQLENLLGQDRPAFVKALLRALLALLRGERSPALADDPELDIMDAVELRLVFFGAAAAGQ